ncbi:hypothetical protein BpHYR1_034095 [Brachionus plicatilis]|uniref:Uncharacterized protein n=1 Tax=Brachionus plicatilis TaxID=10195 RepID=A0A3M7PKD1_BRAPC|nr:hypothetical protein BpHYR1_034095 [Brachionus plicatilis]
MAQQYFKSKRVVKIVGKNSFFHLSLSFLNTILNSCLREKLISIRKKNKKLFHNTNQKQLNCFNVPLVFRPEELSLSLLLSQNERINV